MATYLEIISQIEELKKQAVRQRREEYSVIIKAIKKKIADYGITAEELGLSTQVANLPRKRDKISKKSARTTQLRAKHPSAGKKLPARYKDEAGNTWTGRGKKPKWVETALASGRSLDSFLID